MIEEVCDRYGADGVEIDEYIRVFFKPSEVTQNIPILTEWMRVVRSLLDDIGRRQGRELSLAIRVHPSEQACLDIGMDVRTWIREGIIDWVTPFGDVTIIDPEPHFGWMVEEAREVGVGIYPAMGRDTYDDRFHDVTIEMSRAVAGNYHAAGADGVYLADLQWPHTNTEYEVLREMADPDAYARKTKHYPIAPRTARPDPYLPERVLPVTLDQGTTVTVPVPVSDDFDSAIEDDELESVTLGVRLVQPHPNDTITYRINGHELSTDEAKITHFYGGLVPVHAGEGRDAPEDQHALLVRIRRSPRGHPARRKPRRGHHGATLGAVPRRPRPSVRRDMGPVQGPAHPGRRPDVRGRLQSLQKPFMVSLSNHERSKHRSLTSRVRLATLTTDSVHNKSWEKESPWHQTEDRIRKLLAENLEVDGKPLPQPVDFSSGLTDIGVSSMDVVAFAKVVAQEFDVEFTPEICAGLDTLNDLVKCLDGQMA